MPRGVRTASEWAWRLLVIAALVAVVVYLIVVFQDVVVPLLVALLVCALVAPTVAGLRRRHWPKWIAILVCLVVLIVVVAGLVLLVVWQVRVGLPQLERESTASYTRLRDALREPPFDITDRQLAGYFSQAADFLRKDSASILGGALKVGAATGHVLAGSLIALFATIFILIDGAGIWRWIVRLFPRTATPGLTAAGEAGWRTLTSFIRVQIVVALVNAVGIGLVAFFLGLPLAIPIAVIVLLASFIPVIGAIVSGIVAVVIALIFGGPIQAIIMLAGVLGVHLLEAHVLQPLLVGGAVKVHPLAVVVGVAAGTGLAGVPGALFAVPFLAVANAMITAMLHSGRQPAPIDEHGDTETAPHHESEITGPPAGAETDR
ncbi:AI-2E family transporter [Planctomonas sp. JC2975]|uniref:AI-2E family transporter n=1 Tax=Planctomonas sp. JC2975 TaxID=2729626 RepID=UPI0014757E9C|nr:AI-2E family transporter [Planctomonas sp. JC2975]NNC12578.1 AI-2E family transporter [Planctomonas sp. JC2975]